MKKILVVLFVLFLSLNCYAQQQKYYCEVIGTRSSGIGKGLDIYIDFGDKTSVNFWGVISKKLKFVDENGEEIKFNSLVDAANYMIAKGWIFQQAYHVELDGIDSIRWIYYKEADSFENATNGINVEGDKKKR